MSQKKCVPQRQADGSYPLPAKASMVKAFDTSIWNGRWYITAGLNKVFGMYFLKSKYLIRLSKCKTPCLSFEIGCNRYI